MSRASQLLPGHQATSGVALGEQREREQARARALGPGRPLEPQVRARMEARFGTGFREVRLHDTPAAHVLAGRQRAQAFTLGNHIAFNRGFFAPDTTQGQRLLAHELAHVVQQRRGGSDLPVRGGALERAAETAANRVVAGTGPVAVAGASAVALACQPLPEDETADLPPPPRSLQESIAKDEKNLSDSGLELEMGRIEQYVSALPHAPEREQLLSEYQLLFNERVGRRKRKDPASLQVLFENVKRDVEEAHRAFVLTGKVFRTQYPHSWAEIKLGKPMSRKERYDLMLKLQGREHPLMDDITFRQHDPEFISAADFKEEMWSRIHAEYDWCDDEYFWPKYERQCKEKVREKYGGEAYVAWRDARYQRAYLDLVNVMAKTEAVKHGGPVSLVSRAAGYGYGKLAGKDPLKTSEDWATWGSLGDAFVAYKSMRTQRTRLQNYTSSGGHELRADAQVTTVQKPATGPQPTPDINARNTQQGTSGGTQQTQAPDPVRQPPPDPDAGRKTVVRPTTDSDASLKQQFGQAPTPVGKAPADKMAPLTAPTIESRLAAMKVPAGQQGSFATASAEVRKLAKKDPAAAERLLQALEERFQPENKAAQVQDLFDQAQGKMYPDKGRGNVHRQSTAADARMQRDQRDPAPKDVQKAVVRDSYQIGEEGGRKQAVAEKIEIIDTQLPQQYKGDFGVGPDALGARRNKRLLLEFKGGDSPLGDSSGVIEMSNQWAGRKIAEIELVGDKALAKEFLDAADRGDLQGVVYRTKGPLGAETTSRLNGQQLRGSLKNENISEAGLIQYAPGKVRAAYEQRKAQLQKLIDTGQLKKLRSL